MEFPGVHKYGYVELGKAFAACVMFKHPVTEISNTGKVALPGLKQKLQILKRLRFISS